MSETTQYYVAITIFLATYAIIVTEKWNRVVIALASAMLMVGLGILDFHKAFSHYIEWGTITLLIGMMILVGITNKPEFLNISPFVPSNGPKEIRSQFSCCYPCSLVLVPLSWIMSLRYYLSHLSPCPSPGFST